MRSYIFWHYPAQGVEVSTYERALAEFHRVLAASPPPGFRRSEAHAIEGAGWIPGGRGHEDWYLIEGSAALDPLEEGAVADAVRAEHDAAARLAGGGSAGLIKLVRAGADPGAASACLWFGKPERGPYRDFIRTIEGAIPAGWAIWQRQMGLGPAPEFCAVGPADAAGAAAIPASWSPQLVIRRRVWGAPS